MRITDIFDAVRDATYSDFRKFYTGDPNLFHKYTGLSLFQLLFPGVQKNHALTAKNPRGKCSGRTRVSSKTVQGKGGLAAFSGGSS